MSLTNSVRLALLKTHRFAWSSRAQRGLHTGNAWTQQRSFKPADVQKFLQATGDNNPIHTQAEAAQAAGFGGPIVPGILLASLFPAIIGTNFPGAIYLGQTLSFRNPATVGQEVVANVALIQLSGSRAKFSTIITCAAKGTKLVEGSALALINAASQPSS